jgi:pimeloyl-ACP methyl ester carboxylesterase
LRDRHQLVLIDARGHGRSDKPHTAEAYRLACMTSDVVAVLDQLDIEQAHVLGYSMGGRIALGLGVFHHGRVRSLLVGGASGHDRDPDAPDPLAERWIAATRARGIAGLEPDWDAAFAPWMTPALKARFLSNDAEAFIAYLSWRERVGLLEALPEVRCPCLLFCGTEDAAHEHVRDTATHLPNGRFLSLPGLDHMTAWGCVDIVLPHVARFLEEVEAPDRLPNRTSSIETLGEPMNRSVP